MFTLFKRKRKSDAVLLDLEHAADTIREKLNLHANPKGTLYGDVTLRDRMHNNDTFNCLKLGRGGWSIMSRMEPEEIEIREVNAEYVLVIETAAMYERLVEENFSKKHKAILVGTGGQAARGTRRIVHRLHAEYKLPVYVFSVDGGETILVEEEGLIKNYSFKEWAEKQKLVQVPGPFSNERSEVNVKALSFDDQKTSLENVRGIIRHPIFEELFEIKTDVGYNVKLTRSHGMIVYDSKINKFAEKTPMEINTATDYAIVSLDVPNNESLNKLDLAQFMPLEKIEIHEDCIENKKNKTKIPRFLEKNQLKDFSRLLGYYAAEGSGQEYAMQFSFNANETKYIEDVCTLFERLFGIKAKLSKPHATETQVRVHNTLLSNIFIELCGKGADNKRIPFIIFNVSTQAKKEFLLGYFRGDGRIDVKEAKSSVALWAKTVSKHLAYDLVVLLAQIGCFGTIQYPKFSEQAHEIQIQTKNGMIKQTIQAQKQCYLVSISNKNSLNNLKELVLELSPIAQKFLDSKNIKTPKLDSLPKEFVKHYRNALRSEFKGKLEQMLPPATFQWPRISKQKLRNLLNSKENLSKELNILKQFANNKTTLCKIKDIVSAKPLDGLVYDLEISRTHRFFANNICVHNTDGDPYGWYIYSVIKQGSMALAAHSDYMSCPEAKYVGMTLDDVEEYKLKNVTEKMKEGDIKRAKEMMEYPWFQNKEWQRQLKKAIDEKIRIEQQALANRSLDFVARVYLPEKIKNQQFLP